MKATKSVFVCSECGYQSPKWLGKCPNCDAWNSFEEDFTEVRVAQKSGGSAKNYVSHATKFSELETPEYMRTSTGIDEFDRVLGGGIVSGSVVLLSGEPGIGKSTLLLQISNSVGNGEKRVLYVSGEESGGQLKMRAKRLGVTGENLHILIETNIENILSEIEKVKPDTVIVDSIQTIYSDGSNSSPGSVTQVRECAFSLIEKAKNNGISIVLVGHVNKEGGIAGPKVLEHMVDAVLYFEGDRQQSYRVIRAIKNRYGSTNEIGVFEMTDKGLLEVPNPSEMLLDGRPKNVPGNCAVCTIEGTRPLIAEIQALVTQTPYPAPRRTANGVDYNRMCLILAVLEKRLGLRFSASDVYMNVIGGLRLDEPATDLAVAMSLISSLTDKIVPDDLIALGEIGLSGECRAVSDLDTRIRESVRLGFKKALVPAKNLERRKPDIKGIELVPVKSVYEVLKHLKKEEKDG